MIEFGPPFLPTSRGLASVGDFISQMYKLKTELPSTKPFAAANCLKPQLRHPSPKERIGEANRLKFVFCKFTQYFNINHKEQKRGVRLSITAEA